MRTDRIPIGDLNAQAAVSYNRAVSETGRADDSDEAAAGRYQKDRLAFALVVVVGLGDDEGKSETLLPL